MSLTKLIEAVEAGKSKSAVMYSAIGIGGGAEPATIGGLPADQWHNVLAAFDGSIDAAKRLHEALLPGWSWCKPAVPWEKDSVAVQSPEWQPADDEEDEGGYPWFKGNAADPARAWLLAILRALEQEGR